MYKIHRRWCNPKGKRQFGNFHCNKISQRGFGEAIKEDIWENIREDLFFLLKSFREFQLPLGGARPPICKYCSWILGLFSQQIFPGMKFIKSLSTWTRTCIFQFQFIQTKTLHPQSPSIEITATDWLTCQDFVLFFNLPYNDIHHQAVPHQADDKHHGVDSCDDRHDGGQGLDLTRPALIPWGVQSRFWTRVQVHQTLLSTSRRTLILFKNLHHADIHLL